MLDVWTKHHNIPPTDSNEVTRQIIWFNSWIVSDSNKITRNRWQNWIDAGILTIGHICHPSEGRLLSQDEIVAKYAIRTNFLEALSLRSSIPFHWKWLLSGNIVGDPQPKMEFKIYDQRFELLISHQRDWYNAMVSAKAQEIKRKESWTRELTPVGDPEITIDWEETYKLPYRITRETRLQTFFYKIAHRLCPCNKYLHTIWIKTA